MFEKLSANSTRWKNGGSNLAKWPALAVYLCSDEASFITGSNYPIDGGFLSLDG